MLGYLARRLALAVLTAFAVVTITFVLVHAAPGEPLIAGAEERLISPEAIARQRARFGLDRPISVQYVLYVRNLARGDLGESLALHRPVAHILAEAIPNTLLLGAVALVLSFALGVGVGLLQAARAGTRLDTVLGAVSLTFYSMPAFWLGLMLLLVFGEWLRWFPVAGMVDPVRHASLSAGGRALDVARHLVLPAVTLALVNAAGVARFQRAALLDVLGGEFVRTARAKGLSEATVLLRHALRGALAPTLTLAGLSVPFLLAGSVLVESVFAWPGMGRVAYAAIFSRDYPVITAVAVIAGLMVALGNLLADLAVAAADPRVRRAS